MQLFCNKDLKKKIEKPCQETHLEFRGISSPEGQEQQRTMGAWRALQLSLKICDNHHFSGNVFKILPLNSLKISFLAAISLSDQIDGILASGIALCIAAVRRVVQSS